MELELSHAPSAREAVAVPRSARTRPARSRQRRHPAALALEGRGWVVSRLAVDVAALVLALAAAQAVAAQPSSALALLPFAAPVALATRGLYRCRMKASLLDGVLPLVAAITVAVGGLVVVATYASGAAPSGAHAGALLGFALLFVAVGRITMVGAQRLARLRGLTGRVTLIVGAGDVGTRLAQRLLAERQYGLRPVGFLDVAEPVADTLDLLGTPAQLRQVVAETGAEHVILAFGLLPDSELAPVMRDCAQLDVSVSCVPRLFESMPGVVAHEPIGGLPLVRLRRVNPHGGRFALKHGADRVLAALLLLTLTPVMLALALAVRLGSPGAALYRQRRVGRDGEAFDMLKFRSMRDDDDADEPFELVPGSAPGGVEGHDRRTLVGRLMRRLSLDELPQLINVLRGEMSLVGPRPERPEFAHLFNEGLERYDERHRVKSGMTGWAQVNGLRGQTSLADRLEHDNFYIEHWSLGLDLKIFLRTVAAVLAAAE